MTNLEKLELTNKEIQEMQISNDLAFFTHILPDTLKKFLDLTYFNIDNEEFQYYIGKQRQIVEMTIEMSIDTRLNETDWQKEFMLTIVKRNIKALFRCIHWAFEYYIGSKELLLQEEIG